MDGKLVVATSNMFDFHPENTWGNDPIWRSAYFSDGWGNNQKLDWKLDQKKHVFLLFHERTQLNRIRLFSRVFLTTVGEMALRLPGCCDIRCLFKAWNDGINEVLSWHPIAFHAFEAYFAYRYIPISWHQLYFTVSISFSMTLLWSFYRRRMASCYLHFGAHVCNFGATDGCDSGCSNQCLWKMRSVDHGTGNFGCHNCAVGRYLVACSGFWDLWSSGKLKIDTRNWPQISESTYMYVYVCMYYNIYIYVCVYSPDN